MDVRRCAFILKSIFHLDDRAFVTELYREFLEREPDTGGLEDHVSLLQSGTSRMHVASGIAGSPESMRLLEQSFEKPIIAMSTLGMNGRFANSLFQYAFLHIYAKRHGLRVETPDWIGRRLFGAIDRPLSEAWPMVRQHSHVLHDDFIPGTHPPFKNVDFWGFFQYHTSYYAPDRDFFRELFVPVPAYQERLQAAVQQLSSLGRTVVGLHLRRGDYGHGYFLITPSEWYKQWLTDLWPRLDAPVLFLASDELDTVTPDFAAFRPITSRDLNISMPEAEFYPDFYLLSHCDYMAISNSSFSFAASMLNERGVQFMRPDPDAGTLVPFDPWNTEPLWRGHLTTL